MVDSLFLGYIDRCISCNPKIRLCLWAVLVWVNLQRSQLCLFKL
ncbi:hypothetical protein ACN4EG_02975 [Alkalinema pantanalense CENA528]